MASLGLLSYFAGRFAARLERAIAMSSRTSRWVPAAYGLVHAFIDFSTVTAVFRAARHEGTQQLTPFLLILGYDLAAFALQFPLGVVVDRLRAARFALFVGLWMTAGAVLSVGASDIGTMVLAGVGNALFHLGAGAIVLGGSGGRAEPAGVFVAPGAIGLGLGLWLGRNGDGPIWPLSLLLALGIAIALFVRGEQRPLVEPVRPRRRGAVVLATIVAALLFSIVVRSFVGFGASHQCPKTTLLVVGIPAAAFTGKLLGGVISDRFGWVETSVGALVLSAPLIAFNGGSVHATLAGLLIFQATMPVTLTAVYLMMPKHPATAFGLPCFALIAGAIPTFYPEGQKIYGALTFLSLVLASAVALWLGLMLLGIHRRKTPEAPLTGGDVLGAQG
jgi:FSR family fosmidomycin resistance protein-like MFS transporter